MHICMVAAGRKGVAGVVCPLHLKISSACPFYDGTPVVYDYHTGYITVLQHHSHATALGSDCGVCHRVLAFSWWIQLVDNINHESNQTFLSHYPVPQLLADDTWTSDP